MRTRPALGLAGPKGPREQYTPGVGAEGLPGAQSGKAIQGTEWARAWTPSCPGLKASCGQARMPRRPSSTHSRCWTPTAKAASTRTSECGCRHPGATRVGGVPTAPPRFQGIPEGRISPTHTGPVVTAIQTIAGSLAPLGATSARHRERTYSVRQALAPRGVGVREGSLWAPPHPTPVPRTHPEPGSHEAPAL